MGETAKDMDDKVKHLMETAIKIKEALSKDEIRLQIYKDYAKAIVTVPTVNDLGALYQMADGLEIRLVPVESEIEITLYAE